jgi:GNAT superfamily N-acetyltransferase
MVRLRAWEGPEDTCAMQRLASRLWPSGLHPGGLGWALAIGQLANRIVLAEHDGGLVGWAGISVAEMHVQVDPTNPDAAQAVMEWAVETAAGAELTLAVADSDEVVRSAALDAGFVPQPEAEPGVGMFRPATPDHPDLAAGYTIRGVEPGEATARVEVHRAAWLPSALPWPPGDRPPIPPDATSSFTAPHYDQVRRTWLYDPALDLVVVAPDGTLAACCIAWWEPATGCAEIEPLGVVPEHRRLGLAGALCLEVAAQVAERNGNEVFINTGPNVEYWVPAAAYAKVGFKVIKRNRAYHRGIDKRAGTSVSESG